MKHLFFIWTCLMSLFVEAQNCNCKQNIILEELIPCSPIVFSNNSKLFWSYNCDSSWLTFEGPTGTKKVIFTLGGGLVEYTTRLGYTDFKEYKSSFLVTNNVISGCCDPQEYYVHDKTTGSLIKYIGRAIYIGENNMFPYIVSLSNSNQDVKIADNYSSLTIYNLNTQKEYRVQLPKNEIKKAFLSNNFRFPEEVFLAPILENNKLILKYLTSNPKNSISNNFNKVEINLDKYSR